MPVQAVTARAKEPQSVREKLRRKHYENPETDLTDLVGARIITYYSDEVDKISGYVRSILGTVDSERSGDKRDNLTASQFGYRSVHIIGTLPESELAMAKLPTEPPVYVEIQIRTLLEHAWAQVEHEVVYKSGVVYDEQFRRRVYAVASTLEILDRELENLRDAKYRLVDTYIAAYRAHMSLEQDLDSARLAAAFEVVMPQAPGWRSDAAPSAAKTHHSDALCVEILQAAGVRSVSELIVLVRSARAAEIFAKYAAEAGCASTEVPHYYAALLVAAIAKSEVVADFKGAFTSAVLAVLTSDDESESESNEME